MILVTPAVTSQPFWYVKRVAVPSTVVATVPHGEYVDG